MSEPIMSKAALCASHEYYNVTRWENKAKKLYGKDYVPAKPGEKISEQALMLRRQAARDYHRTHPEVYKRAQCKYWEKKASMKGAVKE